MTQYSSVYRHRPDTSTRENCEWQVFGAAARPLLSVTVPACGEGPAHGAHTGDVHTTRNSYLRFVGGHGGFVAVRSELVVPDIDRIDPAIAELPQLARTIEERRAMVGLALDHLVLDGAAVEPAVAHLL